MEKMSELDQLAFEFFKVFSRLEYALKASGFLCNENDAKADWRLFANQVESLIQQPNSLELQEAVDFVFDFPPKKQVVNDERKLDWSESKPSESIKAQKLLIYVRRVRNNLFHGGKFNGHWFEPERSEKLIRCSLVILTSCKDYVSDVRNAYLD